jgi:hypothetical protein
MFLHGSGFFRNMLLHSTSSSSLENPIELEEELEHLEAILTLISGHPCQAVWQCDNWDTARNLYRSVQKYELDRVLPWISQLAATTWILPVSGRLSAWRATTPATTKFWEAEPYSLDWPMRVRARSSTRIISSTIALLTPRKHANPACYTLRTPGRSFTWISDTEDLLPIVKLSPSSRTLPRTRTLTGVRLRKPFEAQLMPSARRREYR